MYLSYGNFDPVDDTTNVVTIEVEEFLQFDETAEHDETETDFLRTRVDIRVRGFWHPKATKDRSQTNPTAAMSIEALRQFLLTPRRKLVVRVPDGGDGSSKVILRSPLKDPAGVVYQCDAKNGPIPRNVDIQEIIGESAMLVDFSITTWINECTVGTSSSGSLGGVNPILSNRWTMSHLIDENFRTTRIVTGTAHFRTDLLYNAGGNIVIRPDQFRARLFPQLPFDAKRRMVKVDASPDGSMLNYAIEDEERDSVIDNFRLRRELQADIAEIKGTYTENVSSRAEQVDRLINAAGLEGAGRAGFLARAAAIANLAYPTKTYQLNVQVRGTRRASRISLVRTALRASASFRIGTFGQFDNPVVDVGERLRVEAQKILVSSWFLVDIVDRYVEMRLTYTTGGGVGIIARLLGLAAGPIGVVGQGGVAIDWAGLGNRIAGMFGGIGGDVIDIFRDPNDARPLAVGVPQQIAEEGVFAAIGDELPGVTFADAKRVGDENQRENSRFGPWGDTFAFGVKNSRGTALASLVHQTLGVPCIAPRGPVMADKNYNEPANPIAIAPPPVGGVFAPLPPANPGNNADNVAR